jgi:hypothetical protein
MELWALLDRSHVEYHVIAMCSMVPCLALTCWRDHVRIPYVSEVEQM